MMTWTLFILLIMDNGAYSVLQGHTFTSEESCERAAYAVANAEMVGVSRAIPVCKEFTNV